MEKLLAEHADLHVACLKWPKTTGSQTQPTWRVTFGYASDNDASPWNLFEPELICEANLSFADNTRSAMDFGSSGELRISGIHLRLRRGSWLALARTALRRTQLKIAAGDISSEGPVDFDICDQGTLLHQKLTKAEFGTNAKIATSVRGKDLPSTIETDPDIKAGECQINLVRSDLLPHAAWPYLRPILGQAC